MSITTLSFITITVNTDFEDEVYGFLSCYIHVVAEKMSVEHDDSSGATITGLGRCTCLLI